MTSYLGSPPLRVAIANVGIGPAYIRYVRLRVDGSIIEGHGVELLASAIGKLGDLTEIILTGGIPRPGDVFAVGEREDILFVPDQAIAIDALNATLHRLTFEITYASAYGDESKVIYSPGKLPITAERTAAFGPG